MSVPHRPSRSSMQLDAILLPALALLVSAICSTTIQGRIRPPKLVDIIASSDCIVLGKVVGISKLGEVQIAEVEVERVLKGERTIKEVVLLGNTYLGM
jgi:hypothetical protein